MDNTFFKDIESEEVSAESSLAPLIDVVFQLLVFFLLTSAVLPPALEVDLPGSNDMDTEASTQAWQITITQDARVYVDGEEYVEGLTSALRALFEQHPERTAAALHADRQTPYSAISATLQSLAEVGIANVYFVHEAQP